MSKILAVIIAGMFASGAYAQATKPGEVDPTAQGKPAAAAAKREAARTKGMVPAAGGGDINKTPEGGAIGTGKAAVAGEARAETRDTRRRNKDGSVKRKSTQGGTPQ
jgi:hypothetical protein